MNFSFSDYYNMYKKQGIRLPICYFFENHLFDLLNHTNTHFWLPKSKYSTKPKSLSNGVLYMSSWTSIIKKSTQKAISILKTKGNYQLIDIGCGKGKVLCVWELMFKKDSLKILGLEYSEELIKICLENLKIINSQRTVVIKMDALNLNLDELEDNLLIYLYNPFNEKILIPFLKKIKKSTVIVYINPVHAWCFNNNFNLKYKKDSWHPNAAYNIYSNF